MDEGEEARAVLVEAGAGTPEVFALADAALDELALLVRGVGAVARCHPASPGWDRRDGVQLALDVRDRRVRIVAPVGQHLARMAARPQRERLRVVARRAAREDEPRRVAEGVDQDVELAAEPAPRPPQPLRRRIPVFWGAPAAQARARTTVAPSITLCRSGSSATAANSRAQPPRSSQRAKRFYTLLHAP